MKTFRNTVGAFVGRRTVRRLTPAATILALTLGIQTSALAQATTMVAPRQMVLLNDVDLTNTAGISTNAALPSLTPGCQSVGVFTNTLIPFSGTHAIGLTLEIVNTNNFAHSSNIVVTVYPAYDTGGGNANSLSQRYGTNFSSTPLLTWTVTYTTNSFQSTNLPAMLWEPATALGYTITNTATATAGGAASNVFLTLTQSVAP